MAEPPADEGRPRDDDAAPATGSGPAGAGESEPREPAAPAASSEPDVAPGAEAPEASGDLAEAVAEEAAEPVPSTEAAVEPAVAGSRLARLQGRAQRLGARIRGRFRLPRSRRGVFALLLVIGGFTAVLAFGGVTVLHWTETADFCGRCHAMGPELAAHDLGPHRELACAECHVEPGLGGFVKAKLNGTRQLVEVLLGTFPEPIPPPDHASLPSPEVTCMRCHSVERVSLAALRTRTQFTEDEANTRQFVGLMIRPRGGDVFDVDRSVHWHVLRHVTFRTPDEDVSSIDYVAAIAPDGSLREFIAQDQIRIVEDVAADLERIKARDLERPMTCYDCHNRVGHPLPNPRKAVDEAMTVGDIDPSLPYIKREAMRILWSGYPSDEAADDEAEKLRLFYELRYPDIAEAKAAQISEAITEIQVLYRLTSAPDMKVSAATYPDHLGHRDFPGCFRCHDGGHYLIAGNTVTRETIPSSCDTCHTFPQLGTAVASLPLGIPPSTHSDPLYVFSHRDVVDQVDPGGTSCGECHARDYCVNCHATGAVTVSHDAMLINHAAVIRTSGAQACAYCHQPVYCARCHTEEVLPGTQQIRRQNTATGSIDRVPGVTWQLVPPG